MIIRYIASASAILTVNNILTIAQSVLGNFHWLSAGTGGELGAQIGTNTAIELRSPGLFTFITGNASFSVISTIFILASMTFALPYWAQLLRLGSLFTLPIAIVRSISRTYFFLAQITLAPFLGYLMRKRFLVAAFTAVVLSSILLTLSPPIQSLIEDGFINFQGRMNDAGGIQEGIINRFINSFWEDAAGSGQGLIGNIIPWLQNDPLSALLGTGLGSSSPLFRFASNDVDTNYGLLSLNGIEIIVGETQISTLIYELGLINIIVYAWFLFGIFRHFRWLYSNYFHKSSRPAFFACLISFIASLYYGTYFRPGSVFANSSSILTLYACYFLSQKSTIHYSVNHDANYQKPQQAIIDFPSLAQR